MRRFKFALLAGLTLWLGTSVSQALTLADIRSAIRRNVRDTASSASLRRYSDATLLTYINEAQRSVINDTWAESESVAVLTTLNGANYDLPANAIKVWRITYVGTNLLEVDVAQLYADTANVSFNLTASTPTSFYFNPNNPTQISIWPKAATAGASMVFSYFKRATDLSADADIPYDGDYRLYPYHDLLVYHATYRILVSENRLSEATVYETLYDDNVELMNANVGHKPVREIKPSKEIKP